MDRPPTHSRFLAALPPDVVAMIVDASERRRFVPPDLLHEQDEPVHFVILPESGVVSMVTVMDDGQGVEAVIVGHEGVVGYPLTPDGLSLCRAIVQVEGGGLFMPVDEFGELVDHSPELRRLLHGFTATLFAFSTQSTACNRFHELSARLARWLLLTHDRAEGDDFHLTQEFLASMLGAHRPSVTVAVGQLVQAGLIEHRRGRVSILDRGGLEQASCECYRRIRARYDALLPG